jgi:hypothetical protein
MSNETSSQQGVMGEVIKPASILDRDISDVVFPFQAFEFDPESTALPKLRLKSPWILSIMGLQAYANNAAALAAGLVAGDLYRIGDTVGIVH